MNLSLTLKVLKEIFKFKYAGYFTRLFIYITQFIKVNGSALVQHTTYKKLCKWNTASPIILLSIRVVLFGLMLYDPVNSYGHVGTTSSPNHTFFLGKPDLAVNQYFLHILLFVVDKLTTTLLESAEGRKMAVEIISWQISTKVWDQAWIELMRLLYFEKYYTACLSQRCFSL